MKAVIVTGLSGAGKTQAIDCLEDMGYYCIDNMPPALIKSFIDLTGKGKGIDKAAFVIDVRGGRLFDDLKDSLDELQKDDIDYKILYLEASDRVLLRRYNESRRQHPLSEGGPVAAGLKLERERLEVLRKEADYVIDTSNMKTAQLWAEIKHMLTSGENQKTFIINIMSFGYKRGTPMAADMVFDMVTIVPGPYFHARLLCRADDQCSLLLPRPPAFAAGPPGILHKALSFVPPAHGGIFLVLQS